MLCISYNDSVLGGMFCITFYATVYPVHVSAKSILNKRIAAFGVYVAKLQRLAGALQLWGLIE